MPKSDGETAKPMRVSALVLEGCTTLAPVGVVELLRKSGELHQLRTGGSQPFFDIELISDGKRDVEGPGGISLRSHRTIQRTRHTDLLILPAIELDVEEKLAANRHLVPHIRRLVEAGAEVASMCTGAFLLASTGLLDGKAATTHWAAVDKLGAMFPEVRVHDERVVIDNGGIYTAGGATSFMSLALHLVEKFCGRQTAVAASKMFLIDFVKPDQTFYAMFTPQMAHGDEAIRAAQDQIHSTPVETLPSVSELARESGLSARNFMRRFKAAAGESPGIYLQRVRVEAAKDLLETTMLGVDQVAQRVGYQDVPSFRRVFVRQTGLAPIAYRGRYQRMASAPA